MRKLILLVVIFLVGCEQDPLKNFSEDVREGVDPSRKVEPPRPACKEGSLSLQREPFSPRFVEGEEGRITFWPVANGCDTEGMTVLMPDRPTGSTFELEVDAQGEEVYVFRWTPPDTFVSGDNFFRNEAFSLKVVTSNGPGIQRLVNYTVLRSSIKSPEITGHQFRSGRDKVFEGDDNIRLYVWVKDPDSDFSHPPRLRLIMTNTNETNGALYAEISKSKPWLKDSMNKIWEFDVDIRTPDANIVESKVLASMGFVSSSQFEVPSKQYDVSYWILNKLGDPEVTWSEKQRQGGLVQFVRGQNNSYTFKIFDPRRESKLTVDNENLAKECGFLPGDAKCSCQNTAGNRYDDEGAFCVIQWKVPLDFRNSNVRLNFEWEMTNWGDSSDKKSNDFDRTIYLVDPSPLPNPPENPPGSGHSPEPPVSPPVPPLPPEDPPANPNLPPGGPSPWSLPVIGGSK